MKKAQSISINVIVVAAIALIVMILLIMIFTGRMRIFNISSGSCETSGGRCIDAEDQEELCSFDNGGVVKWEFKCYSGGEVDKTKVCCITT
jgi:hypothetical protein